MLANDDTCFVCGKRNPDGLQLEFTYPDDATARTVFVPGKRYEGWRDIVHGGIILTLLDETMAKAAVRKGYAVVTGEIQAKFKAPARVLDTLHCEARVIAVKRSIVYAQGAVHADGGRIIAEATAKMVVSGKPHTAQQPDCSERQWK